MAEQQLFRVTTRGCGTFHVVAPSFDGAAQAVSDELNAQDYGYSGDRYVERVETICREQFMSDGRRALYGEKDENHLILTREDDRKHVYVKQRYDRDRFDGDDEEAVVAIKRMCVNEVAAELGKTLIQADWAYLTTGEEADGVWIEAGIYVDELPNRMKDSTAAAFIGNHETLNHIGEYAVV